MERVNRICETEKNDLSVCHSMGKWSVFYSKATMEGIVVFQFAASSNGDGID